MPSAPSWHAWANTVKPSSAMCSLSRMPASVLRNSRASVALRSRNGRLRRSSPSRSSRRHRGSRFERPLGGATPRTVTNRQAPAPPPARQADIYRRFGLSFDYFGRSSSPENHGLTQHFYRRLDAGGLIEERDVQQVWSPRDQRFLPDRYVLGTCPHCGSSDARGN
jgi:hypothetical protein